MNKLNRARFYCQLFFYVASFAALTLFTPGDNELFAYDSDILTQSVQGNVRVYYSRHLRKLRQSVKPRFIHLIDTRNYKDSGSILKSGVLFTYKNSHAREVFFISSLDRYKKHAMIRNEKGVWYYILPRTEYEAQKPETGVRYKFVVDGLYVHDKTHDNYESDRAGGLISLYYLNSDYMKPKEGVLILQADTHDNSKVLFRFYAPQAHYVSLVGTFNNWDSGLDRMERVNGGYFEIVKSLPKGRYAYLYRADENVQLDKNSPELKFHPVYGRVGYFEVP